MKYRKTYSLTNTLKHIYFALFLIRIFREKRAMSQLKRAYGAIHKGQGTVPCLFGLDLMLYQITEPFFLFYSINPMLKIKHF